MILFTKDFLVERGEMERSKSSSCKTPREKLKEIL
jgi:hypothetical protein